MDKDGLMYGWGKGPNSFDNKVPILIPMPKKVKRAVAGRTQACCIDVDGDLYTWGKDSSGWFKGGGMLGHGNKAADIKQPT